MTSAQIAGQSLFSLQYTGLICAISYSEQANFLIYPLLLYNLSIET